jgi:hypothetical protein
VSWDAPAHAARLREASAIYAAIETLVWRPPGEKMHLGTATWNDVCALELDLPSLVREMCTLLSQYTLQLPVAAAIGSTSLVRYKAKLCHGIELPERL